MPSSPGISTSSRATSGPVLAGRGDHLVAPADLGDDLEVGLQVEQRGQRAADQRLVVGEQQPDRRGHAGTVDPEHEAAALGPAPTVTAAAGRRGPLAQAGRARARPAPVADRPARRSAPVVGDLDAVGVDAGPRTRRAPLCRTTLVTPSRTTQPNSSRRSRRHVVDGAGQVGVDAGRRPGPTRAPASSPAQA